MLVITNATLDQFQNALGLARRTRDHIQNGCHDPMHIVLKVAQAYWRWKHNGQVPSFPNERAAADRLTAKLAQEVSESKFFSTKCRIRLVHESGNGHGARPVGGYVVLEGELLGLHCLLKGQGDWLLQHAVNDGADRLDTLAIQHLLALYDRHGFKQVLTEPNWNANEPDVVWMRRS